MITDIEAQIKMEKLWSTFPQLDEHFYLNGLVGKGTFSTVFVAKLKYSAEEKLFAIKQVVPTCHPSRIKFELQCLKEIGGIDNVAGINMCLRNENDVIFVMPFQRHDSFSDYVGELDAKETANYMKNLLVAIARVHKFNIIHRDIKPSNFLYDRENKKFLLVDFGLAQKQSFSKLDQYKPNVKCKDTSSSLKRKRDPLSPVNEVSQVSKRSTYNLTNRSEILRQKENKPYISAKEQREHLKEKSALKLQFEKQPIDNKQKTSPTCHCYGKPQVCSYCMINSPMVASRAGTPGFRPPEVLFKYAHQTTAVDVWAAGVILLSILSNCANFFSCQNDFAALAELVTIFGFANMNKIAQSCGCYFLCSEQKPPVDLRKLCCTLRARKSTIRNMLNGEKCKKCSTFKRLCLCRNAPLDKNIEDMFPPDAYDFLQKLLDLNPSTRITAVEALKHPFLNTV